MHPVDLHLQTSKVRPTDYAITERHVQNLIHVLSDGATHDTLDQMNRFAIDVVSDIFYGTPTNTLRTQDQSLRDAIQRHKNVNTLRLLFGFVYLAFSIFDTIKSVGLG